MYEALSFKPQTEDAGHPSEDISADAKIAFIENTQAGYAFSFRSMNSIQNPRWPNRGTQISYATVVV